MCTITGTSGTFRYFSMMQDANCNQLNNGSANMPYRFPSWYQPKPVQSGEKTGTDTGCDAAVAAQASAPHGDTVPVLCTENTEDMAKPVHRGDLHVLRNQQFGPIVPEVPVSMTAIRDSARVKLEAAYRRFRDFLERWDERAAIMASAGGLPRADAEWQAYLSLRGGAPAPSPPLPP